MPVGKWAKNETEIRGMLAEGESNQKRSYARNLRKVEASTVNNVHGPSPFRDKGPGS